MQHKIYTYFVLLLVWFSGCNLTGIFNDDENSGNSNQQPETDQNAMLIVEITGGFAGVNQKLVINDSGFATFAELDFTGATWEKQLSAAEIANLKSVMAENKFFELNEAYVDERVADAFFYEIFYKTGTDSNLVVTNNFGVPEELQNIVETILSVIEQVKNNGLDLSLELSKDTLKSGEEVKFKLTITNSNNAPIDLHFNNGQIYDFEVFDDSGAQIWNWAYNKFFTLAIWETRLLPGLAEIYEITWDGTNNDGELVTGNFKVQAALSSVPGGKTSQKRLNIIN